MKGLPKCKASHVVSILYLLVAASLSYFMYCYYDKAHNSTAQFYEQQSNPDGASLKQIMRRVSMSDNTVIVTILDKEWARKGSLFDIFLEGFKVGHNIQNLLNHIVVFTVDGPTHEYCKSMHSHCINLAAYKPSSRWEPFKDLNDPRLGWKVADLLGEIVDFGYHVLFTETDVLWLRNPFLHLSNTEIATVREHVHREISDIGFFYVKSNDATFQFLKYWKMSSILYPNTSFESVFEIIKEDITEMLDVRINFIDTPIFNTFCESTEYTNMTCAIHAKCYGSSKRKVHNLSQIIEYMKSLSAPLRQKS